MAALDTLNTEDDASGATTPSVNYKAASVKGVPTVQGIIASDPTQTKAILESMQRMIDERSGPMSQFMGGLKDATAWTSGGAEGPSAALTARDREKAQEAQELMNMRMQMATTRAAQSTAERRGKVLDQIAGVGGAKNTQQIPTAGVVKTPPDLILKQMAQKRAAGDDIGAEAVYDDWIKTQTHKDIETAGRAESYSQEVKVYDKQSGQLTSVPAIEAIQNPSRYSYTPVSGATNAAPGAPTTSVAPGATNLGNMRPSGQSTGFQPPVSPADDLVRIDNNLKDYGTKGMDTLAKVISRWSPPSQNDTAALIQNASKLLNLDPNQKIDLTNPAVRHLLTTALIKQEGPMSRVFGSSSPQAQSGPPATTGNRAQDLQNIENWKKTQEKELEIASKGPEQASTEAGKRRSKMFELADATDNTVKAADMAIAASTSHPEASGIGKGRTGANLLVTMGGAIVPKMDKSKAEDQYAALTLSDEGNKAREAIVGSSKQLGIDFAANVFKGARMGIGLENMAANAKNVSEHNTAETNIINAKIIKEAALFNRARAQLYNQWAPNNGGALANFEKFETSPEYQALAKATQEKIASELPQYLKLGKDGLQEINPSKKSSSENNARAELERRKKAKENQ